MRRISNPRAIIGTLAVFIATGTCWVSVNLLFGVDPGETNPVRDLAICLVSTVVFALLAWWCFAGKGFKQRDKREI
jgi:hypothetical protein